jgi:hypothetical protein
LDLNQERENFFVCLGKGICTLHFLGFVSGINTTLHEKKHLHQFECWDQGAPQVQERVAAERWAGLREEVTQRRAKEASMAEGREVATKVEVAWDAA